MGTIYFNSFTILLVNIPTSIIIARSLGAEGQGTYFTAIFFPSLFGFIALLGMDSAYTHFISGRRFQVSQVVDRTTGVHGLIRKAYFGVA